MTGQGTPVSAQTVWKILEAEGIGRLAAATTPAAAPRTGSTPSKPPRWAPGLGGPCCHATTPGCCCWFPPSPAAAAGPDRRLPLPATSQLSAWQSIGTLLLAKCGRISRIHHIDAFTDDTGLGFALGLTALPKATHLTSYSYRIRRDANQQLLHLLVGELQRHGLATGQAGFNLDFHAIRHHGTQAVLAQHYVPARLKRTRAVRTFFAQDHASTEMVYAGADITKAEQPQEIIAFADSWRDATGAEADLLVFDSQLTTYTVLDELTSRGIRWLTLRKRGPKASKPSTRCPQQPGKPSRSNAPAATATPTSTKT